MGDVSWYNATKTIEIFKRLRGVKHLIVGNHDNRLIKNAEFRKLFVEITDYKELDIGLANKQCIVLCHYPIPCFKNHYYNWIMLYGHVHNGWEYDFIEKTRQEMEQVHNTPCRMYNVGAMMPHIQYQPRTLHEIINNSERKE